MSPNHKIHVIAPSFRPENHGLYRGLEILKGYYYDVTLGKEALSSPPRYVSPYARLMERYAELVAALKDDSIDAIWCVDGGAGVYRLLPLLDQIWDSEIEGKCKPKPVVGFSDITFLQLYLVSKNWPAILGPNIWCNDSEEAVRLADYLQFFRVYLENTSHAGSIEEITDAIITGESEGILLGGTLSPLLHLIGTRYAPTFDKAIIFVDEHGPETPGQYTYLFWEKLQHAELIGFFDTLNGFVLGDVDKGGEYATDDDLWPQHHEIVSNLFKTESCPVSVNFPFGIYRLTRPIPLGVAAKLTVTYEKTTLEW